MAKIDASIEQSSELRRASNAFEETSVRFCP
jgi:hypothetical protein